jgi:uncharacterized OB-fold protein
MSTELPAPAPDVNPETREYWDATAQGRLLLKRCLDCGSVIWYPRALCPQCASLRTEWFEASGRGRVYSYTLNHRGQGAYSGAGPYVLAYVELDEAPSPSACRSRSCSTTPATAPRCPGSARRQTPPASQPTRRSSHSARGQHAAAGR